MTELKQPTVTDKLEISELLSKSAYALDHREIDLLESCFAVEATFTLRIADGDLIGPFEPRTGIMQLMTDSMERQTDQRRHVISNVFFQGQESGGFAVQSNLTLLATEDDQIQLVSAGIYTDVVACIDGQWQFVRRHLHLDKAY